MKVIYLSGPMTVGPQFENVREALRQATLLREAGYAVICPHLTFFWDLVFPTSHARWLGMDFAIIERVDLVLRIPGESRGGDLETAHARYKGIAVYEGRVDEWLAEQAEV